MTQYEKCAFCDPESLKDRVIRLGEHSLSLVSKPWFRPGHSLVIPRRHVMEISELQSQESSEIMSELGRLCRLLDEGYGTGVMKFP